MQASCVCMRATQACTMAAPPTYPELAMLLEDSQVGRRRVRAIGVLPAAGQVGSGGACMPVCQGLPEPNSGLLRGPGACDYMHSASSSSLVGSHLAVHGLQAIPVRRETC
jgi:hypothetical protein